MTTTLLVGSTPDALAAELVRRIGAIAKESVLERGVFNVSVSGGSMPKVFVRDHAVYTHVSRRPPICCISLTPLSKATCLAKEKIRNGALNFAKAHEHMRTELSSENVGAVDPVP